MVDVDDPLLYRTLLLGTNNPGDSETVARKAVHDRFSTSHDITEVKTDPQIHAGAIIDRHKLQSRPQSAGLRPAAIIARLCRKASQPRAADHAAPASDPR